MASDKRNRKPLTAEQREKHRLYMIGYRAQHAEAHRASSRAWAKAHREEKRLYNKAYRQANLEKLRAKDQAYAASHREEQRLSSAAWYRAHPEQARVTRRKYRLEHAEKCRVETELWRATHPAACRGYESAWRKGHPEQVAAKDARRRARKASAPINDFTAQQWREMQEHYQHRCVYCGKRAKGHLTQDHITPLVADGCHTVSNIVPACRSCNGRKGPRGVLRPIQPVLLV